MNLKLRDCDYAGWFTEEELGDDKELYDLPPLEGDKEEKEGKGLKIIDKQTIDKAIYTN